ncbi:MAG: hypothetical protein HW374_1282, partial [Bacteroidetes bacterium]|nr:hypothetical protein [Bacteroidota bacterium]
GHGAATEVCRHARAGGEVYNQAIRAIHERFIERVDEKQEAYLTEDRK